MVSDRPKTLNIEGITMNAISDGRVVYRDFSGNRYGVVWADPTSTAYAEAACPDFATVMEMDRLSERAKHSAEQADMAKHASSLGMFCSIVMALLVLISITSGLGHGAYAPMVFSSGLSAYMSWKMRKATAKCEERAKACNDKLQQMQVIFKIKHG